MSGKRIYLMDLLTRIEIVRKLTGARAMHLKVDKAMLCTIIFDFARE